MLIVGVTAIASTMELRRRSDRVRASLWIELTAALESLHSDHGDRTAISLIVDAISKDRENAHSLEVVASVVALNPEAQSVIQALGAAELDDALVAAISDGNPRASRNALELAGLIGARGAVPVTLMRCIDEDPDIRRVATRALARLAPVTAFEHLIPRVTSEPAWAIELMATLLADGVLDAWLGQTPADRESPRAVVDLVNLLAGFIPDDSPQRELAATDALGSIDHRAARAVLGSAVQTQRPIVANMAAAALSRSEAGQELLDQLENDKRSSVSITSLDALVSS